jgi:hypothetical protein
VFVFKIKFKKFNELKINEHSKDLDLEISQKKVFNARFVFRTKLKVPKACRFDH